LTKAQESSNDIQREALKIAKDTHDNLERAMRRQVTKEEYDALKEAIKGRVKGEK
jgi:hypothetical protein